jgi:putative addiction module component (TIGR02574 family)
MLDLDEILQKALSLDVDGRAVLAERLLQSLDSLSDVEADRLWADESERRLQDFRAGKASSTPASIVFDKAKKLLK